MEITVTMEQADKMRKYDIDDVAFQHKDTIAIYGSQGLKYIDKDTAVFTIKTGLPDNFNKSKTCAKLLVTDKSWTDQELFWFGAYQNHHQLHAFYLAVIARAIAENHYFLDLCYIRNGYSSAISYAGFHAGIGSKSKYIKLTVQDLAKYYNFYYR